MLYTIFTTIVFIAEIIITITIFQNLMRLDTAINNVNETLTEIKPSIKDVCDLGKKISEQLVKISENIVEKVKKESENSLEKYLSRILLSALFLKINSKFLKRYKHSKLKSIISKGLKALEFVI